jgi:hypothetical protein
MFILLLLLTIQFFFFPSSCFFQCLVFNVLLLPNVHQVVITTSHRCKLRWFNIGRNYIPYKSIQDSLE